MREQAGDLLKSVSVFRLADRQAVTLAPRGPGAGGLLPARPAASAAGLWRSRRQPPEEEVTIPGPGGP
jgi:hypothetical protein